MRRPLTILAAVAACTPGSQRAGDHASIAPSSTAAPPAPRSAAHAIGDAAGAVDAAAPVWLERDGNDDELPPSEGVLAERYRLVRVGRAPLALTRVCDITAHDGALFLAHANMPLGTDGATITSYRPEDTKQPFRVAYDWNRPGEPTRGGGAGQGFLRIRRIEGRLYVPDADPPHDGFGVVDHGTEGYVFISDARGSFAAPRQPHHRLPVLASADGGAGVSIVPRAYHVLDAIRFRGRLYLSTGSVPPDERAWRGPAPGALHVANADLTRFSYEVGFPFPYRNGAWRLTYLVRFRDRLYAGIQDYDAKSPYDYVTYAPPPDAPALRSIDAQPARVTDDGAASTLRWFADDGRLYWIAGAADGVKLRVTRDGDTWDTIDLPANAGRPTDIRRFRNAVVVLTERALLRLDGDRPRVIGEVEGKTSPFKLDDTFCSAPLGVLGAELYAGGQNDGALYRWAPE